ncbi:MAG: YicC family protein [Hyphomicrobiales bacterium]|nr:YicC family protein [Hyphomicrobiales bacterium]
MTLHSMTGFARSQAVAAPWRLAWEIKTVNAKGLDLRLRVPAGFDSIEQEVRARLSGRLTRGACYATLTAQRDAGAPDVRVNEAALAALRAAIARVPLDANLQPASLDGLLSVRGVIEVVDSVDDEDTMARVFAAALASLDEATTALVAMRASEGAALAEVLTRRLDTLAHLAEAADACPGRKPEAVRERLAQSIATLAAASSALDPVRLHQEAILIAAKADIREELDRLKAHVAAARELVASGKPVGRRLDFLAQELGRESNTLCAKSNDAELTRIGMELRVEVEQFREQVQNIE